jgi:ATP-dependent DNA helicase RecG
MNKSTPIDFILSEGEGYKIEFKEAKAKLDREIVAFANAAGGSIYLGINDHNQIVGLSISNKLKSEIITIAHNCDPSIKVDLIVYHDISVLEIQVHEGSDKPYRCTDGFFLRAGSNTQKLKRDEIIGLISTSDKVHMDEALNTRFHYPNDFSKDAFNEFLVLCDIKTKLSPKDILLNLHVANEQDNKILFTNTGVLFFAKKRVLPATMRDNPFVLGLSLATDDLICGGYENAIETDLGRGKN